MMTLIICHNQEEFERLDHSILQVASIVAVKNGKGQYVIKKNMLSGVVDMTVDWSWVVESTYELA